MDGGLMNSTLNGPEYNALLHAIWRLQRDIKSGEYTGKTLSVIERDLGALEGLFQRL